MCFMAFLLGVCLLAGRSTMAGEPEAYQHLAERMDVYFADDRPRVIESYAAPYPPGPDGTLERVAFTYDNALAAILFTARGGPDDLRRAKLICDALLWYQGRDPFADGRLRQAYRADQDLTTALQPKTPTQFNHSQTGELAWAGLALLTYFQTVRDPQHQNPFADPNARYVQGAITLAQFLVDQLRDDIFKGIYLGFRELPFDTTRGVPMSDYGAVTTQPQEIRIPLTAFASQGINMERLRAISLVFGDAQSPTGTVTLQAIKLVNAQTGASLVIDDFADTNPVRNALGFEIGGIVDISPHPTGRTLRWNSADGSIDYWYSLLVADPNALPRLDGADYTDLALVLSGAAGGERLTVELQGYQLAQPRVTAKSTEHNLDAYVLFMRLFDVTGQTAWRVHAEAVKEFLQISAWDAAGQKFWTGTLSDGAIDQSHLVEDVQSWAVLALGQVQERGGNALNWVEQHLALASDGFSGVDYGINTGVGDPWYTPDPDGVWFEGTAHMASAYQVSGRAGGVDFSDFYLSQLDQAQQLAMHANGKGLVTASHDGVTSGFPFFSLFASPHIGATSWYLAATRHYNPFWHTSTSEPVPHDTPAVVDLELSGRILEASGQPHPGALVRLFGLGRYPDGRRLEMLTDAQGAYWFEDLQTIPRVSRAIDRCRLVGSCRPLRIRVSACQRRWWFRDLITGKRHSLLYLDPANPQDLTAIDLIAEPH